MKKFLFLIVAGIVGCTARGGFHDIAKVRQAKRNLREIRNAIEQYRVDHGQYPPEGSNLKEVLSFYLSKVQSVEGEEVRQHILRVADAKNKINIVRSTLEKCAGIKDENVFNRLKLIEKILRKFENELAYGGEIPETLSILKLVKECDSIAKTYHPEKMEIAARESLSTLLPFAVKFVDSLRQIFSNKKVVYDCFDHIYSTFMCFYKKWQKESAEGFKVYPLKQELSLLKKNLKEREVVSKIEQIIELHDHLQKKLKYADLLKSSIASFEAVQKTLKELLNMRENAIKSAKIVLAQATIDKMSDAILEYWRKKGAFPSEKYDIEKIVRPAFVETTMGGKVIDRWEEAISYFTEPPVYVSEDTTRGFVIYGIFKEGDVKLSRTVRIVNKWDELVSAFKDKKVEYITPDPKKTFFLKARADDSGGTVITDRPARRAL